MRSNCYHCGVTSQEFPLIFDEKVFCSRSCENVYATIMNHGLSRYYDMTVYPGTPPKHTPISSDLILDDNLLSKHSKFWRSKQHTIALFVPNIKGNSCIWLLENLHVIFHAIIKAKVDFHTKNVRITYNSETLTVKELIVLLTKLGYYPYISLGHPN